MDVNNESTVLPTVIISGEEYLEMKRELDFLKCLRGAGVDNWDGYDDAWEAYREIYPEDED